MVDEWVPEPLVPAQTALEEAESERLPVLVGCVTQSCPLQPLLHTSNDRTSFPCTKVVSGARILAWRLMLDASSFAARLCFVQVANIPFNGAVGQRGPSQSSPTAVP